MWFEVGITFLFSIGMAFLATIDIAFSQLSDVGLRLLRAEAAEVEVRSSSRTETINEVLDDRSRFRFILSALIQVLQVAITVLITFISLQFLPDPRFIFLAFVVGYATVILFRQFIPRLIVLRSPERSILLLLPAFTPVYKLSIWVARPWYALFDRLGGNETDSPDKETEEQEDDTDVDLQALIDVGEEEGIIEEREGEMIHTIIEFGDTRVSEIMTPRTEIVALPITATVRQARDLILESKYSRIPIYEGHIDNFRGLVYVRDLIAYWISDREDESIVGLLRPTYGVPSTKPVAALLEEMQKAHIQLVMVIDEYGGVAGLATIEDILEEIVGEIEDEDSDREEVKQIFDLGNGCYEVLGSTEIGKVERLFNLEIEKDDFTTIAGLVISETGAVPPIGTKISFHGLEIEVMNSDERRIERLRVSRKNDGDESTVNEELTGINP